MIFSTCRHDACTFYKTQGYFNLSYSKLTQSTFRTKLTKVSRSCAMERIPVPRGQSGELDRSGMQLMSGMCFFPY